MIHDMYLLEVKKPEEVLKPWDYYKVLNKYSGEQSFATVAVSKCYLLK
jgi:branched-chain amino acid transport system substrate-binding protein